MIYFCYELRWKSFDPEKAARMYRTRSSFELSYTSGTLEGINDKFYSQYAVKEDILCYVTSREDAGILLVYVAAQVSCCDEKLISGILNKTFPDCVIHRFHEVTVDEFKLNIDNCEYGNGRRIFTKLKIDYRMAGILL